MTSTSLHILWECSSRGSMHITGTFCCGVRNAFIERGMWNVCIWTTCMALVYQGRCLAQKSSSSSDSPLNVQKCLGSWSMNFGIIFAPTLVQITSALPMSQQFMLNMPMQINKSTYKWDWGAVSWCESFSKPFRCIKSEGIYVFANLGLKMFYYCMSQSSLQLCTALQSQGPNSQSSSLGGHHSLVFQGASHSCRDARAPSTQNPLGTQTAVATTHPRQINVCSWRNVFWVSGLGTKKYHIYPLT